MLNLESMDSQPRDPRRELKFLWTWMEKLDVLLLNWSSNWKLVSILLGILATNYSSVNSTCSFIPREIKILSRLTAIVALRIVCSCIIASKPSGQWTWHSISLFNELIKRSMSYLITNLLLSRFWELNVNVIGFLFNTIYLILWTWSLFWGIHRLHHSAREVPGTQRLRTLSV